MTFCERRLLLTLGMIELNELIGDDEAVLTTRQPPSGGFDRHRDVQRRRQLREQAPTRPR